MSILSIKAASFDICLKAELYVALKERPLYLGFPALVFGVMILLGENVLRRVPVGRLLYGKSIWAIGM